MSEAFWIPSQPISLRAGRRRRSKSGIEQRAARALRCVLDGELSDDKPWREQSWPVGPARLLTLSKTRERRPPNLRDPLPDRVVNHVPTHACVSGLRIVCTSVEEFEAGRGSRSFRNDGRASASDAREYRRHRIVASFADTFAKGEVPRMTALRKLDGGVSGIVVGDLFRRLVSRTLAKQFAQQVEDATAPFQFELKHVLGVSVSRTFSRASLKSIPARP